MQHLYRQFETTGWCKMAFDQKLLNWVQCILPDAIAATQHKDNQQWLRYQGTWFAGVNILPNNTRGIVANSPPLKGQAIDFIGDKLGLTDIKFDRGQISVCYPGYPQPAATESPAAYHYRLKWAAAHIDGIHRIGGKKERYLREHHAFILAIPLVKFSASAAPFTIWEGSHHHVLTRLKPFYQHQPVNQWDNIKVTHVYQQLRKEIFAQCQRVTIHAQPGEAFIVHRLALHGMAPWSADATASTYGRMICYFRPLLDNPSDWLQLL